MIKITATKKEIKEVRKHSNWRPRVSVDDSLNENATFDMKQASRDLYHLEVKKIATKKTLPDKIKNVKDKKFMMFMLDRTNKEAALKQLDDLEHLIANSDNIIASTKASAYCMMMKDFKSKNRIACGIYRLGKIFKANVWRAYNEELEVVRSAVKDSYKSFKHIIEVPDTTFDNELIVAFEGDSMKVIALEVKGE